MGTMEFQSYVQPLGVGGIQIAKPKDKIDPNKLAYIRNMRVYQIGELRCRPGLGTTLFSSDASGAIHTLRRFNDTLAGTNAAFDTGVTSGLAWVGIGLLVGALFMGIGAALKKKPR